MTASLSAFNEDRVTLTDVIPRLFADTSRLHAGGRIPSTHRNTPSALRYAAPGARDNGISASRMRRNSSLNMLVLARTSVTPRPRSALSGDSATYGTSSSRVRRIAFPYTRAMSQGSESVPRLERISKRHAFSLGWNGRGDWNRALLPFHFRSLIRSVASFAGVVFDAIRIAGRKCSTRACRGMLSRGTGNFLRQPEPFRRDDRSGVTRPGYIPAPTDKHRMYLVIRRSCEKSRTLLVWIKDNRCRLHPGDTRGPARVGRGQHGLQGGRETRQPSAMPRITDKGAAHHRRQQGRGGVSPVGTRQRATRATRAICRPGQAEDGTRPTPPGRPPAPTPRGAGGTKKRSSSTPTWRR